MAEDTKKLLTESKLAMTDLRRQLVRGRLIIEDINRQLEKSKKTLKKMDVFICVLSGVVFGWLLSIVF